MPPGQSGTTMPAWASTVAHAQQGQKMHFLLHSHFPASHVPPMAAIAEHLILRGHSVTWLAAAEHERAVAATGAHFRATSALAVVDAAWRSSLGVLDGACGDDTSHGLRLAAQVADYRLAIARSPAPRRPDVLVVDVYPYGARALHDLGEVPAYATVGVLPFHTSTPGGRMPGEGTHPGSGFRSIAGSRWRHLVRRFLKLPTTLAPRLNAQRRALGLRRLPLAEAPECFTYSPMLHIQASSSRVDFFQRAGPARHRNHTVFTGPLASRRRLDPARVPSWWHMLVQHGRMRVRHWSTVVLAPDRVDEDPRALLVPVLRALAKHTDVVVVVLTSRRLECLAEVGLHPLVLFTDCIPLSRALAVADLLVTNAGYHAMLQALAAAVPIVCAAQDPSPDKKDAAARLVYTGVCKTLRTPGFDPHALEQLIMFMLSGPTFRDRALPYAHELRMLGGARRAAYELEQLGLDNMPGPKPAKPRPKPAKPKSKSAKKAAAAAAAPQAQGGILQPLDDEEPQASNSAQKSPEGMTPFTSPTHHNGPLSDEWLITFEPPPHDQWHETTNVPGTETETGTPALNPIEPPADLLLPGYLSGPSFRPFETPVARDQPCSSRGERTL